MPTKPAAAPQPNGSTRPKRRGKNNAHTQKDESKQRNTADNSNQQGMIEPKTK
jgi:hypothetical protein